MESYIEINLVHHLFLLYLSLQYGFVFTNKYLNKVKLLFYLIFELLISMYISEYQIYLLLMFEVIAYFYLFDYHHNLYFIQLVIRYILLLVLYLFYDGSIQYGMYYIDIQHFPTLIIVFEVLLFLYIKSYKRYDLMKEKFIYDVRIDINHQHRYLKMYLDSGNELSYDSIPVCVVDERFKSFFKLNKPQFITMNTLSGYKPIMVYLGSISYLNNTNTTCYFYFSKLNHKDYHGLLNMKLMVR